jgi:hypothetical protein
MAERKGGTYLGILPQNHPYADPLSDVTAAIHPKLFGGSPEAYMATQPSDMEGYMLPDSELLWLRQKHREVDDETPMSYLDPETSNG